MAHYERYAEIAQRATESKTASQIIDAHYSQLIAFLSDKTRAKLHTTLSACDLACAFFCILSKSPDLQDRLQNAFKDKDAWRGIVFKTLQTYLRYQSMRTDASKQTDLFDDMSQFDRETDEGCNVDVVARFIKLLQNG